MTPTPSEAPVWAPFEPQERPTHWSGVFAMSLCVFALVASEFMPVSLLTPIATDLRITEGMAGQGITISGALAVLTSLSISTLAGHLDRKTLLLALTVLMGISGAIVALAPNYPTYMVGRALIGVVIGGFWSMSAAMAMRLVPPDQVPKALVIFNGGNALAMVIAAPLGSYLGALIGWRGAFFALVPVALIAWAWQWIALPTMKADARVSGSGNVLKLLKNRTVAYGMAGCGWDSSRCSPTCAPSSKRSHTSVCPRCRCCSWWSAWRASSAPWPSARSSNGVCTVRSSPSQS